jgi:hypothetical protein
MKSWLTTVKTLHFDTSSPFDSMETMKRRGCHENRIRLDGELVDGHLSSYERILMAPPCRLIVYQTIDERDDMSGRNPFIVSCRNVMPRQPNRWITDSF